MTEKEKESYRLDFQEYDFGRKKRTEKPFHAFKIRGNDKRWRGQKRTLGT